MSSNSEQHEGDDALVELLYDDELDDEEADRLERELDPQQRAELESYERLLDDVRSAQSDEEVSDSLHASIIEQAEREASSSDETPGASRSPRELSSDDRGFSLWEQIRDPQTASIGGAATALLAIGAVWYVTQGGGARSTADRGPAKQARAPSKTSDRDDPSEPDERFVSDETPPNEESFEGAGGSTSSRESSSPSERNESAEEASGPKLAQTDETSPSEPESSTDEEASPSPERRARASVSETEPEAESAPAEPSPEDGASEGNEADEQQKLARRSTSSETSDEESDNPEVIDRLADDSNSTEGTGSAPAFAQEKTSDDGEREAEARADSSDSAGVPAPSTPDDNAALGKMMRSADDSGDTPVEQKRPARSAEGAEETSEEDHTLPSDHEKPDVDEIASAYRSAQYRKTTRLAHEYLESIYSKESARPRVMEWKARSLEKLKRWQRARETYDEIAADYPDYKPKVIQQAESRASRKAQRETESDRAPSSSSSE